MVGGVFLGCFALVVGLDIVFHDPSLDCFSSSSNVHVDGFQTTLGEWIVILEFGAELAQFCGLAPATPCS